LEINLHLLIIYFCQAIPVKSSIGERNEDIEHLANERKTLLPSGSSTGHKKAALLLLTPRQGCQHNLKQQPCCELNQSTEWYPAERVRQQPAIP